MQRYDIDSEGYHYHDDSGLFVMAEEAQARIAALEAEVARLTKAWEAKHKSAKNDAASYREYFDISQKRMHELAAERDTAWNDAIEAAKRAFIKGWRFSGSMSEFESAYEDNMAVMRALEALGALKREEPK